jgi:hypothetical protein
MKTSLSVVLNFRKRELKFGPFTKKMEGGRSNEECTNIWNDLKDWVKTLSLGRRAVEGGEKGVQSVVSPSLCSLKSSSLSARYAQPDSGRNPGCIADKSGVDCMYV